MIADPTKFTDVIYEVRDRAAWIIINRPKVYNAFRGQTLDELIQAFTIAADTAQFGQVGPKVGSVDAGWGTALLARHVGDKKAREIWFINDRYTAEQAREMGLVNKVVPSAELDAAVKDWTDKLAQRSPTAIALAKRSFNADSDNIRGISNLALHAVKLFYDTAESKEGVAAFNEKRPPDFHKFT